VTEQDRACASNRRDFAKALVALVGGPAALTADEPAAKPKSSEAPASVPDALLEVIRIRYGKQLTPEQLESIKRGLNRQQFLANRLKQLKLKNGDEPAFVFSPDVPELSNR
jgi:hypothetical protein